jgi:hypothetical protein
MFNISDKEAYCLIFSGYFDVWKNTLDFFTVFVGTKGL